MSEQKMDLDTAIRLFDLVETFDEYKEGLREVLTRCHTQEELDRAREVIDEKKEYMIENNPEFNAVMEQRKREAKMRADESKALHKAKIAEADAMISSAKSKASMMEAMAASNMGRSTLNRDLDDFVARTRLKTVDPEVLERRLEEVLWCPICQKKDAHNNIINDVLSCVSCFHKLVPKSELKDYPRKYRRNWLRRRKK